jgi:NADPH:quinone reductase
MRAVTYAEFGPAAQVLSVADLPDPAPGPGEVKVALAYSGVNPSDVKARAGARPGVTKPPFPLICPHSDGAGTITAVGAGVEDSRIGQRVWVWNGQWQRPMGTAAEAILLPEEQAVALPESVSLETGASLGIPGLTAAHTVFGGGDIAGRTLLIHGGNGSVGHLAVQLAKWAGATVVATASPSGFDRCRAAGADAVVDYRSDRLAQDIMDITGGHFFDRIIDVEFGENIATNAEVIAPCGTISAYGSAGNMNPLLPFGPLLFKAVTIDIVLIYILSKETRHRMIDKLHKALSEKALSCPVAGVFALSDTAAAHEAVETGKRKGAILVDPRR